MCEFETWWIQPCCPAISDWRLNSPLTFKDVAQMAYLEGHTEGYSKGYDNARKDIYVKSS